MNVHVPPAPPVTARCLVDAAAWYRLPPDLLLAILLQENGRPGMARPDPNGTRDLGPMQINSVNLAIFARHGIRRSSIRDNGCTNVFAGAFILRRDLDRSDGRIWQAIGNYHSGTPRLARSYRHAIRHRLVNLYRHHAALMRALKARTLRRIHRLKAAIHGAQSGGLLTIGRSH